MKRYLSQRKKVIDKALNDYLPKEDEHSLIVHRAMRYSLFPGGKRLRPILALAACEACGGKLKDILPFACAIELIHTYSLIHDDLPAVDNDDYRRGRPSCHKKFGEAVAILAGDGLLTLSFELIAKSAKPKIAIRVIKEVAKAVGTQGMIGGQTADIVARERVLDLTTQEYIHSHKTGSLIAVSLKVGALAAGASQKQIRSLIEIGEAIGFAFQVVDDILDKDGYWLSLGPDRTRRMAEQLIVDAKKKIAGFGKKGEVLAKLADFILERGMRDGRIIEKDK